MHCLSQPVGVHEVALSQVPTPSQLKLPVSHEVHVPALQYWLVAPQELAVVALQPPQGVKLSHSLIPSQL